MNASIMIAVLFALSAVFGFQTGCDSERTSSILPPGVADKGQETFLRMQCNQCHSTKDIPWKGVELEGDVHVTLSGREIDIRERVLIQSIIDPSHEVSKKHILEMTTKDWKSRMLPYAEILTVQELSDLIAYVQSLHRE